MNGCNFYVLINLQVQRCNFHQLDLLEGLYYQYDNI